MSDSMDAYWKKRKQQLDQGKHTQMPPKDPSQLPHYQPAHVNMPQTPPAPSQAPAKPSNGWGDMNLDRALMARAMTGQTQQQMAQQQSQRVVFLREGQKCYRELQTENFGSSNPIVIDCGNMNGISGKQFEFLGVQKCIVAEGNEAIDLQQGGHKTISLAKVRAPFVGTLLVPESCVVKNQNGAKQVLKG